MGRKSQVRPTPSAHAVDGRSRYAGGMTMRSTLLGALAALLLLPGLVRAEQYRVKDKGDFAPAGTRVEFADRYGWTTYSVDFAFGLDDNGKTLSKSSKLKLTIDRRDGSRWTYTCKAKGGNAMTANVQFM